MVSDLHPRKPTAETSPENFQPLEIRRFLLETIMIRVHDSFPGSNSSSFTGLDENASTWQFDPPACDVIQQVVHTHLREAAQQRHRTGSFCYALNLSQLYYLPADSMQDFAGVKWYEFGWKLKKMAMS